MGLVGLTIKSQDPNLEQGTGTGDGSVCGRPGTGDGSVAQGTGLRVDENP